MDIIDEIYQHKITCDFIFAQGLLEQMYDDDIIDKVDYELTADARELFQQLLKEQYRITSQTLFDTMKNITINVWNNDKTENYARELSAIIDTAKILYKDNII